MFIDCDMNAGASGGGWVADGVLLSLNSYCVGLLIACTAPRLYGPYFGAAARGLYEQSRGRLARCLGRAVTQLGAAGRDSFAGASGRDVISLRGGTDTGLGRRANDTLCGGSGDDTLRGGPGFDVCDGGAGARPGQRLRSPPPDPLGDQAAAILLRWVRISLRIRSRRGSRERSMWVIASATVGCTAAIRSCIACATAR